MVVLIGGQLRIAEGPDGQISCFQAAIFIQVYMFRQADIELAILVLHPDVVIRQAVQGGSPNDIQLLVELLADDFRGIVLPVVPGEFQAVLQGSDRMDVFPIGAVLSVLVDDPSDVRAVHPGLAVGAVFPRLAFFGADEGGGDTVLPILPIDADGTGSSVFSRFPCLAHGDGVGRQVLIQLDGDVAAVIHFRGHIVRTIGMPGYRIDTLDLDGPAHFHIMDFSIRCGPGVGIEIQSFGDSFEAPDGDVVAHGPIGILDLQGHGPILGHRIFSIGPSCRILYQTQVVFQHIAQIDGDLLGIPLSIPVIPGDFQYLPISRHTAPRSIVIVEAGDFQRIGLILLRQIEFASTVVGPGALSVVLHRATGDEYIPLHRTVLDFIGHSLELVFRSRPAFHDLGSIPVGILEACDVIIIIRVGTG